LPQDAPETANAAAPVSQTTKPPRHAVCGGAATPGGARRCHTPGRQHRQEGKTMLRHAAHWRATPGGHAGPALGPRTRLHAPAAWGPGRPGPALATTWQSMRRSRLQPGVPGRSLQAASRPAQP